MKALLPVGIVLVVVGLAGGFARQIILALTTGLPSSGIGWMQTTGFVLAAAGAVMIGAYIGRRRKARNAAQRTNGTRTPL